LFLCSKCCGYLDLKSGSGVQRADETNDELIKNLNSLQERHGTLSEELSSTRQVPRFYVYSWFTSACVSVLGTEFVSHDRKAAAVTLPHNVIQMPHGDGRMVQDLHDSQRRYEEIRQENIKLQQRQEESHAATVALRREQAAVQRTLESKEVRSIRDELFRITYGLTELISEGWARAQIYCFLTLQLCPPEIGIFREAGRQATVSLAMNWLQVVSPSRIFTHLGRMQARLTTALAEAESLVASNRKLIKEEADARTEAERARYEAAAAKASCEHAVQDRQLLEERLQVVQRRSEAAEAAHEQSAKQLRVWAHFPCEP
jgi:hypothetical protein